jgi:hypothetical protein
MIRSGKNRQDTPKEDKDIQNTVEWDIAGKDMAKQDKPD